MRPFFRSLLTFIVFLPLAFSAVAQVPVRRAVPLDFDGDGKTDLASVITRFDGTISKVWWEIYPSSTGRYEKIQFGYANGGGGIGDGPAPADYDGDGKTDIAVTREIAFGERIFIIRNSSDGSVRWVQWGLERYENNPARMVYVRDR